MKSSKSRSKNWLVIIGSYGLIVGMLQLADVITSRPQASLEFAKKFGGLTWILIAAVWIGVSFAKKMRKRGVIVPVQ